MFKKLFAACVVALVLPAFAAAADPVITYQTQPLGRMLNDLRMLVQSAGGDKAVEELNKDIKRSLGEKGFDGFDISRPILGYVHVPANPEEMVAVVCFPVTNEKDWLNFCERWNKSKPEPLKDGLYKVPGPNSKFKAVMKVAEGYAYVATGMKDPSAALSEKSIISTANLYDGTDVSLMMGRLHFDRLPKELRAMAKTALDQLPKGRLPGMSEVESQVFLKPLHQLATRFLELSEGAKDATLRVNADAISGEATAELTVTPLPGSALAKVLDGMKPKMNRFASIITPDAAGAVRLRLPLDIPEVQAAAVAGLEALQKEANNNAFPPLKGVTDELLKLLIRTAKTGDMDGAAVLRGPAKDGTFTGVVALTVDDPSGFEKELKKAIDGIAPQDFKDALKWDAEKVNGVNIHTIDLSKMPGGDREIKAIFGNNVMMAFAFAPKAAYLGIGPGTEAVAAVKGAMAAKPGVAPMLDFAINPDRIVKLVGAIEPQGAVMAAKVLGKENRLITNTGLDITGGAELKIKWTMNLRFFGSFFAVRTVDFGAAEPPPPVQELKK